jgi:hypothetical protein
MSQQIDSFCEKLRGKLNEMDDRLPQLKASAKAGSGKSESSLVTSNRAEEAKTPPDFATNLTRQNDKKLSYINILRCGCAERQQRTRLHYVKFPDLRENTGNFGRKALPAC